jgi:preprotein translocase subunit YajC
MIHTLLNAALAFADTAAAPAATAATTTAAQPSTLGMVLPFVLMFGVFYFLMIRPQQKKMKDLETLMGSLQKGEEVITQSGIFGKVHGIAEKFVTLEVDQDVKIKVLKSTIATVLRGEQQKA